MNNCLAEDRITMGFGFDLVTKVNDVDEREDSYIVEIELAEGALMNRRVQIIRARGRAMIATGLVENVGNTSREIGRAIKELDFDEINRVTELVDGEHQGRTVTVKVDKE